VVGARGAWVPTATSHRGRCLRSTLPKTCKDVIFIGIGEPPGMRKHGLPFRVAGLGGLVMESHPPALNHRVVERQHGSLLRLVHFLLVGPSL
jgi:hypothetical protein